MNAKIFRLVFSKHLGMFVPAHEATRVHGKRATPRRRAAAPGFAMLAALALPVQAQMPVACGGGACGTNPNITAFATSGAAGYSTAGNQAYVTQTTAKAIVNFASYNLGAGNTLTYRFQDGAGNLPVGASFSTLNRIWQGSPSEIAGRIQVQAGQNGQIALINQNGIIFKDGAQVSVGSLIASTLDITDDLFLAGIQSNASADSVAAFFALDNTGGGVVKVESGAELKTESGGRVMLLAENVENHGLIETPEGQTILAAGAKVYLAVSDDSSLRGFLVEVDSPDSGGGTAANTGRIIAERGNVSMTGLTVNQSGRVTATTSVNLNGSIRLMARDTVETYQPPAVAGKDTPHPIPVGTKTGNLVFGSGSVTEVLPEEADSASLTDEQTFIASKIEGVGRVIHVQSDSLIRAQGGDIALNAQAGKTFQDAEAAKVDGVRIQVDSGAVLDVSGLLDVPVAVERNYIQVEVRGDQLKDSPLQRDTFLYKSKVWVDVEQGTPLLNVAADIAKLERTVAEKSAAGGDITLRSEGDLVLQAGALVDVSGGSLAYQSGYGKTSQLVLNGKIVDIGRADAEQVYDGFADQYSVTDPKWGVTRSFDLSQARYIGAYSAGRDAGKLSLTAHNMVLDATLRGEAQAGTYQRQTAPAAGKLALTLLNGKNTPATQIPDLSFVSERHAAAVGIGDALPASMALSTEFMTQGGFGRVAVYSDGRITLPADVTLDAGVQGSVSLTGRRLDIDGDIIAPGGEISLTSQFGRGEESFAAEDYGLNIGADARLDVAGRWVNDLPESGPDANLGAVAVDGGSIVLASYADLTLAAGSILDVSGGAWLSANGKLVYGDAGDIDLASGSFGVSNAAMSSRIHLDGELRAYGYENGGSLSLTTSSIHMGASPSGVAGELALDEAFFGRGGFREFNLSGVNGVTVADGFMLQPAPLSAQLEANARLSASGTEMASLTRLVSLDADLRAPTRVSLTASDFEQGNVHVGEGASIRVDPEGEIVLTVASQLSVLGTLQALAGDIVLAQTEVDDAHKLVSNYDPGRSIFLGANSRLLATGYTRAEPNAQGLRKGEVLDGGTVTITAAKGYLVAQAGSLIDVSGTSTTLDLLGASGLAARTVNSDGGSINLAAREGMLLEGGLRGRAGGEQAQGGSLKLNFDRLGLAWTVPESDPLGTAEKTALQSQRVITLQAAPTNLTADMNAGDALDTVSQNGKAVLAQSQVVDGGFADLSLQSENRIAFADNLDLALNGRLILDAANLSAVSASQANLSAASILMGNSDKDTQAETSRNDASGGTGVLALNAGLIELVGHSSLQGFGEVNLTSQGDIRMRDVVYEVLVNNEKGFRHDGSLATGGNLNLAARQIYPVSMADFALEVHNNPTGRISVTSTGADTPVLSAGGRLSLSAPFIDQRGTIKAPFGEIALRSETISRVTNEFNIDGLPTGQNPTTLTRSDASGGEVILASGSLTSVSAEGQTIPLGATELSGSDWIYDFGLFKKVISTAPEKQIVLDGDSVTVAAGARIDLSGGGNIYAYEFLSGPGGSKDILTADNSDGLYAVLPGLGSHFAAYDHQTYQGLEDWNPGASVQLLQGAHGLAAGNYALLPARYALLPGAYLVRVREQASDLIPGQGGSLANGTALVAGYLGSATAAGDVLHGARTATLEIRPGSVARKYSEFIDTYASGAFAKLAGAQLPGDAGRLSIGVGQSLSLQGELLADYASGRRGPEVDISADKLAVTATGASYGAGYVSLSAEQLDSLGAASLLLGGSRSVSADGERVLVTQRSDNLVIANDADHVLSAPELILVARDTVKLEDGAVVAGVGTYSGQSKDLYVTDTLGNGDGALLRVSTGGQVALSRAPASLVGGVLDVAAGATVRAGKSAVLDATLDNRTLGAVILPETGGALTLGATRISLVADGTQVNTGGLVFNQDRLAALGNPAHLLLRSYSTLDLYGDVHLGGAGLASLGIEAAGLAGYGVAGQQATLQADTVSIANPDGIAAATAFTGTTGQGDLVVLARDVELGKGDVELRGFDSTTMTATGQVLGRGGSLKVAAGSGADGHLTLNAGRVTVAAGADQVIEAAGDLVIGMVVTPTTTTAAALGGKLALTGASLTQGGRIEMPAGIVELKAMTGDVTLLAASKILAGGASVDFADTLAFAGGGSVSLIAELGDVVAQTGSTIDVSGDSLGGDAGALEVWAAGDAKLAGTLLGDAVAGFDSGRFALTADRINPDANGDNDFSALNSTLEAGGFHALRRIRLRQGDIELAATDAARAHEFILSADQGDLRIAGTVDASGSKGGRIELYAGGDLDLLSGAQLLAKASDSLDVAKGTAGEGGRVLLGSGDSGVLSLAAGSKIDVSVAAGSAARAGRVVLRAARTGAGAGTGVAFGTLAGKIEGAERVEVEAYKVYVGDDGSGISELTAGTSSGNSLGLETVQADNDAFVAAVDPVALKGQLDIGAASFHLLPGIEARNAVESDVNGNTIVGSGDIVLSSDWNLKPLRHGDEAGVLTVRAGGNLNLAANLSDGFSTAATAGTLQSSPATWSYRLTAGADSAAADPLAIDRNAASGDLSLAAGKLVRTGSGDIEVAAAGDLLLGSGAALYTAGRSTANPTGFLVSGVNGNAFPTGGGDISIGAVGNVVSETGPSGLLTDWLYRAGNLNKAALYYRDPALWPQIAQFKNGIAALGGGDVEITAGGRVANLMAATVVNKALPGDNVNGANVSALRVQGGGDLNVRAGGDIEGGVFYVDGGVGRVRAGDSLKPGLARTSESVATVLALGDASIEAAARTGLRVATVLSPTLVSQTSANKANPPRNESYFAGYGEASAARMLSLAGDVVVENDHETLASAYGVTASEAMRYYPSTLEATAFQDNVLILDGMTLAPSPVGNLRLLAGGNVAMLGNQAIIVSDQSPDAMPSILLPKDLAVAGALNSQATQEKDRHAPTLLHENDPLRAYVVAREGDILGKSDKAYVFAYLPKAATFQAGRDILDVTVNGQNLAADDVTRFIAGRDIRFATHRDDTTGALNSLNDAQIAIGGPGRVELIAGRDIDLGASLGVLTRGNLTNPYLPEGGADLLAVAGAAAADASGENLSINPILLNGGNVAQLFAALRATAQNNTGKLAADKDYTQSDAAIATLFPTGTVDAPLTYQGDISLFFSQMKTEQGGNIEMLAPGGGVNAGLASVSGFERKAADLGIMTVQGGDIAAYTLGDFQVNSSRVFTISGGDILLWSAAGNIDAGKGAKTASATPPPQLRIDSKGNFVLDVSQSIAGSGIGALSAGSDVYLIAPKGEVNAGDAGILFGGEFWSDTPKISGGDNIRGIDGGSPIPTDTGGLSGSLSVSGLADNTGEATKSVAGTFKDDGGANAEEAKQVLAAFKPTFITVDVLGYGEATASVSEPSGTTESTGREDKRRPGDRQGT